MGKSEAYYNRIREDLVRFVPAGASRVLDVGCGTGATGKYIKDIMGSDVEVTGIEINPVAGKEAASKINKVIIGNVEEARLPFGKGYLDCIIYGDVLEHLVDPWETLKEHSEFLKDEGCVIASIPNVAHYRIVKELKRQNWDYQDSGILDRGHLRFFTIKGIRAMFLYSGLEIEKTDYIISASNIKKFLNRVFPGALLYHITEQYIVVAKKACPRRDKS